MSLGEPVSEVVQVTQGRILLVLMAQCTCEIWFLFPLKISSQKEKITTRTENV